jgi:hypothetical protein
LFPSVLPLLALWVLAETKKIHFFAPYFSLLSSPSKFSDLWIHNGAKFTQIPIDWAFFYYHQGLLEPSHHQLSNINLRIASHYRDLAMAPALKKRKTGYATPGVDEEQKGLHKKIPGFDAFHVSLCFQLFASFLTLANSGTSNPESSIEKRGETEEVSLPETEHSHYGHPRQLLHALCRFFCFLAER